MKVKCMYHTKLAFQYLPTLVLAERVVQTALYSIQRLICIAISTKRLCVTLRRSSPKTKSHSQCSLFFSLLTHLLLAGSCMTKYFSFMTGSFHTNLTFLRTLTKNWDEKDEIEFVSSCILHHVPAMIVGLQPLYVEVFTREHCIRTIAPPLNSQCQVTFLCNAQGKLDTEE